MDVLILFGFSKNSCTNFDFAFVFFFVLLLDPDLGVAFLGYFGVFEGRRYGRGR